MPQEAQKGEGKRNYTDEETPVKQGASRVQA